MLAFSHFTKPRGSLSIFTLVAVSLLVGWAAWALGRAPLLIQIARQQQAQAERELKASAQYASTLHQAQQRGDQLTNELVQHQRQIDKLNREKRDALAQVTTGRTCLNGTALRVLNSAPGLSVASLPQTTSGADATYAPVATYTSDRDIAVWAVDAGAQHEQCRQRLDALIEWHKEPHED